jgi:hypothetical protein
MRREEIERLRDQEARQHRKQAQAAERRADLERPADESREIDPVEVYSDLAAWKRAQER